MFRERARQLGLPFVPAVDVPVMPAPSLDALALGAFARARDPDGPAFIAPDRTLLARTRGWLAAHPEAVPQLQVTTPTAIRAALRDADADTFAAAAVTRLEAVDPRLSARRVATIAEIAAGVILAGGIGFGLSHWPVVTLLAINLFAGAFFFGVTVLRFLAAHLVPARLPVTAVADLPGEVPVYSVLVPLRDEAAIVPQLVAALDRLAWPEDRLDIKLIVESDDAATRQAVEIATRGPPYEIVVVPAGLPRTKPKALAYALTFARGSFVTVYDAEDRPDPRQLAEAWQTFSRSDPRLACLQAPIVIRNQRESLLARSFAVEYSALFDGLLPALAALRMPLPLGGTSNHFRREALEAVGGWDPFNVTEDADLGIRLARFGYRSGTLSAPTEEEAPADFGPWLRQRTRWFKGWIQTWLVHMRRPVRLLRQIGLRQFVGFNLVGAGMLISALIHPVYLATLVLVATNPLALWQDGDYFGAAVIGLNLFNLFAGYLAVANLASRTLALRGRGGEINVLFALPFYWLLMAPACMRAVWQLATRPHLWEKTPHTVTGSSEPARPPPAARPGRLALSVRRGRARP